jgi:hypothetical protein
VETLMRRGGYNRIVASRRDSLWLDSSSDVHFVVCETCQNPSAKMIVRLNVRDKPIAKMGIA